MFHSPHTSRNSKHGGLHMILWRRYTPTCYHAGGKRSLPRHKDVLGEWRYSSKHSGPTFSH